MSETESDNGSDQENCQSSKVMLDIERDQADSQLPEFKLDNEMHHMWSVKFKFTLMRSHC
jgi:hypothetical protein